MIIELLWGSYAHLGAVPQAGAVVVWAHPLTCPGSTCCTHNGEKTMRQVCELQCTLHRPHVGVLVRSDMVVLRRMPNTQQCTARTCPYMVVTRKLYLVMLSNMYHTCVR